MWRIKAIICKNNRLTYQEECDDFCNNAEDAHTYPSCKKCPADAYSCNDNQLQCEIAGVDGHVPIIPANLNPSTEQCSFYKEENNAYYLCSPKTDKAGNVVTDANSLCECDDPGYYCYDGKTVICSNEKKFEIGSADECCESKSNNKIEISNSPRECKSCLDNYYRCSEENKVEMCQSNIWKDGGSSNVLVLKFNGYDSIELSECPNDRLNSLKCNRYSLQFYYQIVYIHVMEMNAMNKEQELKIYQDAIDFFGNKFCQENLA